MPNALRSLHAAMFYLFVSAAGFAFADEDRVDSRERFIEVDREIQAAKQEVLEINREIMLLEEQLLYPHDQQLVVFVSLSNSRPLDIDSVSLALDGKTISRHVYSEGEKAALNNGGVHRLYVGRLDKGAHIVDVSVSASAKHGQQFSRQQSAKIFKGSGRKVMELNIAPGDEGTDPQFTIHQW
jgi:hypothetical protein